MREGCWFPVALIRLADSGSIPDPATGFIINLIYETEALNINMELICANCNELKDCSNFSKKNKSKRGYSYRCKSCHNDYVRNRWYPENKEKQIVSSAKWRYSNYIKYVSNYHKVDPEKTQILYDQANGKCQICDTPSKLCLDHCHNSGEIRGFLCKNCNLALGFFKDNIISIEKALEYLKK